MLTFNQVLRSAKYTAVSVHGPVLLVGSATLVCAISLTGVAKADCTLIASAGNDVYSCSSGSSNGLTDLSGANSLVFPVGGTGTVNGNIIFGPQNDVIQMDSGKILGSVDQGDGANVFKISAGTVSGGVSQGSGVDNFQMTGGTIASLTQGNSRDVFLMTGGTIVGGFDDGDIAKMTGGTIGRVNMKLDDNLFDMSGGTILGNLVTGFGDDTIIVSGGTIGGNISVSGGDDRITVTGGVINGEIRAGTGNDGFIWNAGGLIKSSILMGDGNDTALISHLTEDTLSLTPSVDGGLGKDTLTFDNSSSAGAARYIGWESVNLTNNSRFNLVGDFFLGDSSSGTGSFTIDSTSALQVTNGAVRPYTSGQLTTLTNAGVIDMTSASSSAADTLSVYGNYVGRGGQLLLQTVLGDDSSASDKLIVSQGAISGNTQVGISNLGGQGALTLQNGIEVVQAQNGTTSSADAFALKNSVSAGAYQYYLFKGGVTAGSENNWYLRSSVIAIAPRATPPAAPPVIIRPPSAPPVAPAAPIVAADEPPVEPPTAAPVAPADPPSTVPADSPADASPTPAATTPALPAAVAGAAPIPLFRLEVPVYSVVVPAAQTLMLNALGTFHDRQGDQSLLTETGLASAGWGRFYNNDFKKSWSGTVSPTLDGSLDGFQIGNDLFSSEISEGRYQRLGFFVGQTRLRGSVKGFAEGFQGRQAGQTKLDGDNVGLYWTLSDRSGWYVDAVAMATRLDANSQSDRGVKLDTHGHGLTFSLEGGYPVALSDHWSVEPQAQLISQHISLDDQNDGISEVSFDSQNYTTGRLGVRLNGRYRVSNTPVEPYLRANVWRTFGGSDTVTYDDVDRIKTQHKASSADVGMGVVAQLSPTVAVYLGADYDANLDSNDLKGISGNVGIRMSW